VAAGLATGLGFAMKDILNNFFYGVQLMSGRLRVGDYVECDGVRGQVDSINYQSTTIIAADGSVMAFPNATLFNKNFKNLTRNHSYELLDFIVGVKYGSDVEQVRQIILDAMEPLRTKDKFGREVIEPKFGIQVRFKDFGDNSVNLQVVQFTTVEEHFTFAAKAKELIYNALNANGIEIPFPQRDLYIKSMPDGDK
jgi:small-conductance mechanosensitive channel